MATSSYLSLSPRTRLPARTSAAIPTKCHQSIFMLEMDQVQPTIPPVAAQVEKKHKSQNYLANLGAFNALSVLYPNLKYCKVSFYNFEVLVQWFLKPMIRFCFIICSLSFGGRDRVREALIREKKDFL